MKCANCNEELPAGTKFCPECGTPVPQEKKCIGCGAVIPLNTKFCPECGAKQEVEGSVNGIAMGDKNVIAGDVVSNVTNNTQIHHNETITNTTNNTTIINEDDTKKLVPCESCGRNILLSEAYKCRKCGKTVCKDCFDIDASNCYLCSPGKKLNKNIDPEVQNFINQINELAEKKASGGILKTMLSVWDVASVQKKQQIIQSFMPSRTKRAYLDSILFMESQRDTVTTMEVQFKKIWNDKIVSLITQASSFFGDDEAFMKELRIHGSLAENANSGSGMMDKFTNMFNGMTNTSGMSNLLNNKMNGFVNKLSGAVKSAPASNKCKKCGAVLEKGKKFCVKCGAKV